MRFNTFMATTGESLARATRSTGGAWSLETLLQGTRVNCFAAHPHNPHVVYAGTQGNGVLRSEDWGKTWQLLPFNLGSISRNMIMLQEK